MHLLPEFLYSDIASLHLLLTLSNFIPSCTTTQLDLLQTYLTSLPPSNTSTEKSALVRKLRIKVAGRLGVRALKLQGRRERGGRRAMGFGGGMNETREGQEEGDVGDDVEGVIESLLEGLEDKVSCLPLPRSASVPDTLTCISDRTRSSDGHLRSTSLDSQPCYHLRSRSSCPVPSSTSSHAISWWRMVVGST